MGVSPVNFAGRDLFQPGYYASRKYVGLSGGGVTGSRLLIIGECKAGIPYSASADHPNAEDRVNWVSNSSELNDVLRDGPASLSHHLPTFPALRRLVS